MYTLCNPSLFLSFHCISSSLSLVLHHLLYHLLQIPSLALEVLDHPFFLMLYLFTLFSLSPTFPVLHSAAHTCTHSFCGGRRDANKNETWGLCRRPPADWGTPWEWWSAGSLSLPRRWTRCSGLAAPPPLHPALPLLFHLLSCTGVYQQYTHPGCWASLAVITKSMNTPPHYLTVRASERKQNEYPAAASSFLNTSIM